MTELVERVRPDLAVLLTTRFACVGSTKVTAERLYCHPNTVRHRLRRSADVTEVGTALRALVVFPAAVSPLS